MTALTFRLVAVLVLGCSAFLSSAQYNAATPYSTATPSMTRSLPLPVLTGSQTIANKNVATGTVAGTVTLKGKGVPGISVTLRSAEPDRQRSALIAKTDLEGNYRISNVPAGQYQAIPIAPTFVMAEVIRSGGREGKLVILTEGESVDGIDFTLVKAGVITGKVLDADGKPVVEELVNLIPADMNDQSGPIHHIFQHNFRTDDRGVYRIYGIPTGRYKVSVGQDNGLGVVGGGRTRRPYKLTFHPDTADPSEAEIVEVLEGEETSGIDITVGRILDGFAASGRIIDGETGQPLANIRLGVAARTADRGYDFQPVNLVSSSRGEFKIEGLTPGAYSVVITQNPDTSPFADPVPFNVVDRDVNNLVIKTSKGATLIGVVVLDGSNDKELLGKLYQLRLNVFVQGGPVGSPTWRSTAINPDGSFRLSGLAAGMATINTLSSSSYRPVRDFVVLHTERDGARVTQGIVLKPGDETSGLRVFIGHGNGKVRGELIFVNGTSGTGSRLFAQLTRAGESVPLRGAEVDARGRFAFEGMPAGDYWLQVHGYIPGARNTFARQQVNVVDGVVTEVTITLDLNPNSDPKP